MKNKKSRKANLENKKGLFFLIGLIVSLSSVLLAFEWETQPKSAMDLGATNFISDDFLYIPPTPNQEKLLPPKPMDLPVFELVGNDSEVDVDLELFNSEITDETAIDFSTTIFKSKKNADENVEEIFIVVEEMPEFPGGDLALQKYLAGKVKYPVIAQENGIQGKVYISFVIDESGNVVDVNLVRGIDTSLDNEALRIVRSLPKWKPAKQTGKAVKVRYYVPIIFELQ